MRLNQRQWVVFCWNNQLSIAGCHAGTDTIRSNLCEFKANCSKSNVETYICVFPFACVFPSQTWFWINTRCRALWVRMPGRGSARPCSNSTTTKPTRNWPTAYLLYAPLLIWARSSLSLRPWTRMVSKWSEHTYTPTHTPVSCQDCSLFYTLYYSLLFPWWPYIVVVCKYIQYVFMYNLVILCMVFPKCVHLWLAVLPLVDISFSPLVCVSPCLCVCLFSSAVFCMCVIHLTSKWPLLSNHKISQVFAWKTTHQKCSTQKGLFPCGMAAVCLLRVMSVHHPVTFGLLQEPWPHDPRHALWQNQDQTS